MSGGAGGSRLLNHSRFPPAHSWFRCPRKYRRSVRWPRAALVFAHTFGSLWAFGPTAHRAGASLRCAAGRFALRATAHWAGASLRALPGFGAAPQACAAAQNASVSSGRRSQETRMDAVSMFLICTRGGPAASLKGRGARRAPGATRRKGRARDGCLPRRGAAAAPGPRDRSPGTACRMRPAGRGSPGATRRKGRARDGTCRAGVRRRLAAQGRGGGSRSAGPVAGSSAGASAGSSAGTSAGSSAGASVGRAPCNPDLLRDPGRYRGEETG